jgi:pentatricopeptide repeat protein
MISALGEAQQLQRAQELYEEMQRKLLGISAGCYPLVN